MTYLFLSIAVLAVTGQDIFKKKFNQKSRGGSFLFTAMLSAFAMLFFVAINRDFDYRPILLIPSTAFAISYATANFFAVQAIRCGSLAKTSLIISFSLLIPSLYGILFLNEALSFSLVAGLLLLICSLALINYEKRDFQEKTPAKWYLFVFLAFLGTGMCSTVQRAKQEIFGKEGDNLFMIVALAMVTVIMSVISLCSKEEKVQTKEIIRHGLLWAMLCGLANGLTNYLVILLNTRLPASTLFPVLSSGKLVLAFLYSILVVREKLNRRQLIGFWVGVASIILLNL